MMHSTLEGAFANPVRINTVRVPFMDLKAQYATIREEITEAIQQVLESAHFVGGEHVERFESEFARYVGARYTVATGSGTAALELTLRALGIGPGDEVIVPAYTFFATAEAVSNTGARPVFADVDPDTCHLDPRSAEQHITSRTRAIIPVHLHGRAMNVSEIVRMAEARDIFVIEDACQAHGARHRSIRVGGSGRPTCFSFYPGKNLGAYGDGGAVTCNDPHLAQSLRVLRDHGSPAKYQHVIIGTNSRLDALQAAILSVKLPWLDEWNGSRTRIAKAYLHALNCPGIRLPSAAPVGGHNYHLFIIRTALRDSLRSFLASRGIEAGIHYPSPLHLTQAYQDLGHPGVGALPVSETLTREVLSLPMYPELSREQIREVVIAINEFMALQPDSTLASIPEPLHTAV